MEDNNGFTFNISLSVLNHLGRNLYRSFITVLGEAISNAWDADAKNVWIYVDRDANTLVVKDDGVGMNREDFQGKFLKIGYSKRKSGKTTSQEGRPYIGRKGIGKLALLSCAQKVTVITKTRGAEYVGGVIDNSGLEKAIVDDLTPDKYPLEEWNPTAVEGLTGGHEQGTIIYFEGIKEGIKNTLQHLNKQIALYFRFSLIDNSFNIHLNGEKVDYTALKDLAEKTQYVWRINSHEEPYLGLVAETQKSLNGRISHVNAAPAVRGFIASVELPRHLKILTTDDRVSIDLFVNGRLRERDVLKHIPTARVVESYLYGQIHFNELDDKDDRFTSSREGIVADDPKFKEFLDILRKVLSGIMEDWDKWRTAGGEDGDPDNERITKRERKSRELFGAVSKDYSLGADQKSKSKVDAWVAALADDAQFNFTSYAECFISENLTRKYIEEKSIPLSPQAAIERDKWKKRETESKEQGNVSVNIRRTGGDLSYLAMTPLAALADKNHDIGKASLFRDAKEYKPMRDAVAHTALLTDAAKSKLTAVYENIKARIRTLLLAD